MATDDSRPNIARVHDYVVGGTENTAIDREFAAEMSAVVPGIDEVIRELWRFGQVVVGHLLAQGVDQFLDLGLGLPTNRPIHEVAAETGVPVRVAYVDIDPETVAHANRLLAGVDGAVAVRGDVADPHAILATPEVRATLDPTRPVAVLAHAVLQYVDDATAAAALTTLARACAPGSRLTVTNLSDHGRSEGRQWARRRHTGMTPTPRTREPEQMDAWLAEWEIQPPGWSAASAWDPTATSAPDPAAAGAAYWAVLARRG